MRRVSKLILIVILVAMFLYVAYSAVRPKKETKEGFRVNYAKDCLCSPGSLPQKCGDPANATLEKMASMCNDETIYFCQSLTLPHTGTACMNK
jgi:hypothetical protein